MESSKSQHEGGRKGLAEDFKSILVGYKLDWVYTGLSIH